MPIDKSQYQIQSFAELLGDIGDRGTDGVSYVIPVRLRYRVTSGQIKWTMHLVQAERAFDRATREVCANVAEKTGLPLFYGCPET